MKFIKIVMVCAIFITGFFVAGCNKEKYTSRDTSYLKPPPPVDTTTPPVIDTSVVFDNCDLADGWQVVGSPSEVTTGQKEGAGFIQATLAAGQGFEQFIKTLAAPVNTKVTLSTGELKFWFYVQDPTQLKDGQIQFSSSGDPDKNRIGWDLVPIIPTLKNGWNHLELKFTDGGVTGDGGPDFTAMNFVKIFFNTTANVATAQNYGLDDIRVAALPPPPPVEIDNCDVVDGWQVVGTPQVITTGQKEGTGFVQATLAAGQNFEQFIRTLPAPVNTTVTIATGQFQFWLYVQDPSLLKDGQIQFSSSGDPDKNRVGWDLVPIIPTLKNGWNHLQLNFSDGGVTGDGGPDLTAMNFIKIFFTTTANVATAQNYGLDDIKVVSK